jgi:hypothetical protein
VYEEEDHEGTIHPTIYLPEAPPFSEIQCSGVPLFPRIERSFPPFQAVCLYGGEEVAAWLNSLGKKPWEYTHVANEIRSGYDAEYRSRSPLYTKGADVMLGGWHTIWPWDSFYMPAEMRLIAWTFRDAEPWYEVWLDQMGNLAVKTRTT